MQVGGLILALVLGGCGMTFQKKPAAKSSGTPNVLGLVGVANSTYLGACESEPDKSRSEQESIVFYDANYEFRWSSFDEVDCVAEKRETTYIYRYENVEEELKPDIEGWKTMVFKAGSYTATLHTVMLAKRFSQDNRYSYGDWQVNQPKEINGRSFSKELEAKAQKGEVRSQTVKIDEQQLSVARYVNNKATAEGATVFNKQE